jgi:hypothetical protein
MRKFLIWILDVKPEEVRKTYYHCYGEGAHMRVLGDRGRVLVDRRDSNPYTYGTLEHDAWDDGWEGRK